MFGKFALASISFFFISLNLYAAKRAVVLVDGAMVYKRGDFGAPVLGYLRKGKKIKVSNKTYGPFFRVKLRQGVIGYISDIDVKVLGSASSGRKAVKHSKKRRPRRKSGPHVLAGRKMGVGLGMISYTDSFPDSTTKQDVIQSSSTPFLFLNYQKPADYFDGAVISDANIGLSLGTPSLYEFFSVNAPSGYVFLGDYNLLMPMRSMTKHNRSMYWGAGLMFSYSNVTIGVTSGSDTVDVPAADLRIGASLVLGYTQKIGKFSFKVEPKLYFEKETYLGLNFLFQKPL